jgi:uncharacterized protein YjbI with pentapeptide repeats
MLFEIKHKLSGKVLFSLETKSFKLCIEAAIKSSANLRSANLRSANLRSADLSSADLRYADLSYANLDFSSGIPFWCGGLDVKVDLKIAAQMAYHFCRLDCKDKEFTKAKKSLTELANKFHRVKECGEIK